MSTGLRAWAAVLTAGMVLTIAVETTVTAAPRLGSAVIVGLDGEAEYASSAGDGKVEEGMSFVQGQTIRTKGNGKIVSVLTPGCVLCVAPNTSVDLKQIEMTTEGLPDPTKRIDKNIVIDMPAGGALRFDAGDISPNMNLRVTTKAGDVLASGGRAIVAKDGQTWRVICENANVTFDQNGKQQTVLQGQVLTASPDAAGNYETVTQPMETSGLDDDFVGCRRAADRLAPLIFDVDYVRIGDLLDYIGTVDSLTTIGDSTLLADVSPTTRETSIRRETQNNIGPTGGEIRGRMEREEVWDWYEDVGVIRGVNFVPSTAVNATEMWQEETFDLDTIDKELGYAKSSGYTAARMVLPQIVWEADADGLKERMGDVLAKARKHSIGVVFVLFDDRNEAGREPYLGKQADPVPGVHNSQWTPCPGPTKVEDKSQWVKLEEYVNDIVGSFRADRRILFWDVYNEPGSSGMNEKSIPLVEAAFEWARAADPNQPLTSGIWADAGSRLSKTQMELSDVISFRAYENPNDLSSKLMLCQTLGRPLICSEFLRRDQGNTFESSLKLFAEQRVGWFSGGLVAGKTQTYLPFDSKAGATEDPKVWQFDVLHPDGKPYDEKEIELIRNFVFMP